MKIAASLAIVLTLKERSVDASFTQIRDDLLFYLNETVGDQRLGFTRQVLKMLRLNYMADGYGCWCYFEQDQLYLAHGPAVNAVDEYCRDLSHGYTCSTVDDEACVASATRYNSAMQYILAGRDLHETCISRNTGECQRTACIIEGQFVLNLATEYAKGPDSSVLFDQRPSHSGGFDPRTECSGQGNFHHEFEAPAFEEDIFDDEIPAEDSQFSTGGFSTGGGFNPISGSENVVPQNTMVNAIESNVEEFPIGGDADSAVQSDENTQGVESAQVVQSSRPSSTSNGEVEERREEPVVPAAPVATSAPVPPTLCCGSHPHRFPYKTDGGLKKCCVDRTYNSKKYNCCGDALNPHLSVGVC